MKKCLLVFVLATVVLFFVALLSLWVINRDEVQVLSHVPDADWSEWQKVAYDIKHVEMNDSAVDASGRLHLAWMKFNPKEEKNVIYHSIVDQQGKKIREASPVISNRRLYDMALAIQNDFLHIFWVGEGESAHRLDLNYAKFDLQGEKVGEAKVLVEVFTELGYMHVESSPQGGFMLIWENKRGGGSDNLLGLMLDANGQAKGEAFEIASHPNDAFKPSLIADANGRYHVFWLRGYIQPNTRKLNHLLYYQPFDGEGRHLTEPRALAQSGSNSAALAIKDEELYIAWTKVEDQSLRQKGAVEGSLPNYALYGKVISLETLKPEEEEIELTSKNGPFWNQTLAVDAEGRLHLVYTGMVKDEICILNQVYKSGFTEVDKPEKRLYPYATMVMDSTFVTLKRPIMMHADPVNGVHLVWMNAESFDDSYFAYANTVNSIKVTPLEVIGLDRSNYLGSLAIGMLWSIFYPIVNIIFGLELFYIVGLILMYYLVVRLVRKMQWSAVLKSAYVVAPVIGLAHYLLLTLTERVYILTHPAQLSTGLQWYVCLLAAAVGVVFILINRKNVNGMVLGSLTAFFCVYWSNLIAIALILPIYMRDASIFLRL